MCFYMFLYLFLYVFICFYIYFLYVFTCFYMFTCAKSIDTRTSEKPRYKNEILAMLAAAGKSAAHPMQQCGSRLTRAWTFTRCIAIRAKKIMQLVRRPGVSSCRLHSYRYIYILIYIQILI